MKSNLLLKSPPGVIPEAQRPPLDMLYMSLEEYKEILTKEWPVLGAVIHGQRPDSDAPWPQVFTKLQPLAAQKVELFLGDTQPVYHSTPTCETASSNEYFFGYAREAALPPNMPLEKRSRAIYENILGGLQKDQKLIRMWNIVPGINQTEGQVENYRSFNAGRSRAFAEHSIRGRLFPAASAVGSYTGEPNVYYLGAKTGGLSIENPFQVSAYNYPKPYGQTPPSFVRARQWQGENQSYLFISGTASILGHETIFPGDLRAQTEQTFENLETILSVAQEKTRVDFNTDRAQTYYKIYIRRGENAKIVQEILEARSSAPALYLEADICRENLLVEIELYISIGNQGGR